MKTKIISYSQGPDASLGDIESPLDLIAYCARVSNPENQNNTVTNEKLVKYLMKHKHCMLMVHCVVGYIILNYVAKMAPN